jgi:hypothetical protein
VSLSLVPAFRISSHSRALRAGSPVPVNGNVQACHLFHVRPRLPTVTQNAGKVQTFDPAHDHAPSIFDLPDAKHSRGGHVVEAFDKLKSVR